MLDVPDNVLPYFDFEAYGRDARINDGGHFAPGGYVFNNGGSFVAVSYTHLDVYKRQPLAHPARTSHRSATGPVLPGKNPVCSFMRSVLSVK